MQRLIVAYNPRSSQYVHVRETVLNKLPDLSGFMVGKYAIAKTNFTDNVEKLGKLIKDGDLLLAAGGDATAAIAFNAILDSKKDVTLSVLPCGNFNDFARTLKTMSFEEVFGDNLAEKSTDSTEKTKADGAYRSGLDEKGFDGKKVKKLYPLEILVDGKHFRFASNYVTIGMTAAAVKIFDDPEIRRELQKGHKSSWRSYLDLMKWYFKFRKLKNYLPEFKLNGEKVPKSASDYAAVSGRSMARVMKGGDDYLKPKVFRSKTFATVKFFPLCWLMFKSIFFRTPGAETKGDVLEFLEPATVTLQAEGEYRTFEKVSQIEIRKTERFVKVIDRN